MGYLLVRAVSVYDCNADRLFDELMRSMLLFFVAAPLVKFIEQDEHPIPARWENGKYLVGMRFYNRISLPDQWIVLTIDRRNHCMKDNGYSSLVKKWQHKIRVSPLDTNRTLYTDEIEIEAGILTSLVVLFAKMLFKHRQKRLGLLIQCEFRYKQAREMSK